MAFQVVNLVPYPLTTVPREGGIIWRGLVFGMAHPSFLPSLVGRERLVRADGNLQANGSPNGDNRKWGH